jgi:hypothetical protein
MNELIAVSVQLLALWLVLFGTLFMMSRNWAFGFARWSLRMARRILAVPFTLSAMIFHALAGAVRGGGGGGGYRGPDRRRGRH